MPMAVAGQHPEAVQTGHHHVEDHRIRFDCGQIQAAGPFVAVCTSKP